MTEIFKTQPLAHQLAALNIAGERREFALLMEQGTGKSWVILLRAARLARRRLIDRLLIIAPSGVHIDWIEDAAGELSQLNKHWPPDVAFSATAYRSGSGVKRRALYAQLCGTGDGNTIHIMSVNIEAIRTKNGFDLCKRFLQKGKALLALDESSDIKTPSSTQSKRAQALSKHAAFVMIATGTEVTQGPMDFYAQFQFLAPGLLGAQNYAAFKARYAEWDKKIARTASGKEWEYEVIKSFKNLHLLKAAVAEHSFQIMKKDCLDIPEKMYRVRTVELSDKARQAYDTVKERLLAEFPEGTLTAAHPLTRMMRLSQIAGGFWTLDWDDEEGGTPIPGPNAKLDALLSEIDDLRPDQQFIAWARFKPELRAISAALAKRGVTHARYHGDIPSDQRTAEASEFKAGRRRGMIAQQQAGGKGHTWIGGTYVYYYSNSYSYEQRKQSEDRAHRFGQREVVTYTDIIARDTFDVKVLRALKVKEDVAMYFKGSTLRDTLS